MARTIIKICGITNLFDALMCARANVDLLGLNFYPPSPRAITPEAARAITDGLRLELGADCPVIVGVFVNASVSEITRIMRVAGLDAVQLSGDESESVLAALAGKAFKGIRPRTPAEAADDAAWYGRYAPPDGRLPSLLIDAYHPDLYGGTGDEASQDAALAARAAVPRLVLAGGLKPENVAARVAAIQPWGVDVASGVEAAPGKKDVDRLVDFVQAVDSIEV